MSEKRSGRLRVATNRHRRRIEAEVLSTTARLQAAERLAAAVEAAADLQPPEVRAALRAYREAGR